MTIMAKKQKNKIDENKKLLIEVKKLMFEISLLKNGYFQLKNTTKKLEESDEIIKNTNSIIIKWNKNRKIIFINDYGLKFFGYKKNEIIGKSINILVPKKESTGKDLLLMIKNIIINPEKYIINQNENIDKKGNKYWISWTNKAIKDNKGRLIEILTVGNDITQLKTVENNLINSQKKYVDLLNNFNAAIVIHSPDTSIISINKNASKLLGLNSAKMIGKKSNSKYFKFISENGSTLSLNEYPVNKIINKMAPIKNEIVGIVNNKNHINWVLVSGFPEVDNNGKIVEIVISFIDITSYKINEQKLKSAIFIIENTLEGHALLKFSNKLYNNNNNNNNRLLYVNKAWEKMTGYSAIEVVNKKEPFILTFVKNNIQQKKRLFNSIRLRKVFQEEMTWINKKGNKIILDVLLVPILKKGISNEWFNTIRDITERKKRENIVIEVKNRNEAILNSIGDASFACDVNNKIILFNKIAEKMTGYSANYALGLNYKNIFKLIDSKTRKSKYDFIDKVKQEKKIKLMDLNTILIKSDGTEIPVLDSASPVMDSNNNYLGFVVVLRDVSKENELEQAKNEFISMTSHQLRTPLSATKWVLETLFSDQNPTLKQKEKYEYLNVSNERLINLVNKMLSISRIESGKLIINKKNVDLEKLIVDLCLTLKTLSQKNNKNIKYISKLDLKNIYCDPILTHEILENLLINAIEYATDKSTDINIEVKERKDDYLISIHNDGFIEPSSVEKIKKFGKFVRGTGAQEIEPAGSGLGLYITKKITEESGGKIWFESNSKDGTTFYVTIIKNK